MFKDKIYWVIQVATWLVIGVISFSINETVSSAVCIVLTLLMGYIVSSIIYVFLIGFNHGIDDILAVGIIFVICLVLLFGMLNGAGNSSSGTSSKEKYGIIEDDDGSIRYYDKDTWTESDDGKYIYDKYGNVKEID